MDSIQSEGSLKVRRGMQESLCQSYTRSEKTPPAIAGFEDGREPQAKECEWPPETGKGKKKKQDSSQEPPERKAALPSETHFTLLTPEM